MVVIKEMISCGAFGEVFVGFVYGHQVAVKMLPRESRKDVAQVNALLSEAKLMSNMDHHRIVQFVAVAWNSLSDLCVISEFMSGGDLRGLLNAFEKDPAHPKGFDPDKMKIAIHTANALVYMHSLQPMVLHRDLKSKNILLNEHLDAKLADFGVSREHGDMTMTAGVGTSLWMAPEVLMGERYDDKADVFSFGVVLAELDVHTLPYRHAKQSSMGATLSETAILQMVSAGMLRVEFSSEVLSSIRSLGLVCVDMDPRARPTAAEVLHRLARIARDEIQMAIRP
jgi:serine/threonine-protein kinase TNNI3K